MKDCKDCKYFGGYAEDDGTPFCDYENDNGDFGYEFCPYNDQGEVEEKGLTCEINMPQLQEYIAQTIANSVQGMVRSSITCEIKEIIKSEYEQTVKEKTARMIDKLIEEEIKKYMSGEITIGGGWSEPERTLSRNEYLAETISKELNKTFKTDQVKNEVTNSIKRELDSRVQKLKDEVNNGIKTQFNDATRQSLSENVVQILMCSDTYKRLEDSMNRLLK